MFIQIKKFPLAAKFYTVRLDDRSKVTDLLGLLCPR